MKVRRQRPLGPLDSRNPAPRRRHGMAPAEVAAMLRAQGYRCAICGSADWGDISPSIDHSHAHCPGTYGCRLCVRGLLCKRCNNGLASFLDDPGSLRRAADYIERTDRWRR
jgi:hypothetical protein